MESIERKKWLENRTNSLGGSDAAVVLGISPWKSRLELWDEKVSKNIETDDDNLILKLGNFLEPLIADEYVRKTGRRLEIRPQKIHPKYDFIAANVDREIMDDPKGPGILEIKTKGAMVSWHGNDVPIYYKSQIQHYLSVYGYDWASFAILDLGTRKVTCVDVERDDSFISSMIDEEKKFWKLVQDKTPPSIDGSESCSEFLKEYYKESKDIVIDLTENEDAKKWAESIRYTRSVIKKHEALETEARNHLMQIVQDAQKATGDGFSITWKAPKDKEVFDLDRFRVEYPKLVSKYMSDEPQKRRLTVRFAK